MHRQAKKALSTRHFCAPLAIVSGSHFLHPKALLQCHHIQRGNPHQMPIIHHQAKKRQKKQFHYASSTTLFRSHFLRSRALSYCPRSLIYYEAYTRS